ncbi:hypothetical protein TNCV_2692771 [Trichonephila clavipes]|uniref:Uncharacterized protein n=1 Tax=Trichonephila clavipes TaxID=2585209 RepID=A0A8X6VZ90_TRICX|nr:hypothetical protein TNCV_2692771 [Trichonephila clavipes]
MQSLLLRRLERNDLQKFICGAESSLRAVEHMDTALKVWGVLYTPRVTMVAQTGASDPGLIEDCHGRGFPANNMLGNE